MADRLTEFLNIIQNEEQEELNKMESRTKVECSDARNKIVSQGV